VPPPSLPFTPAAREADQDVLVGLARFVGEVDGLFRTHWPGNANRMRFESLCLESSGRFSLRHPHTHLEVAGWVMRDLHSNVLPPASCGAREGAGCTRT
jgi:hypothetical protein